MRCAAQRISKPVQFIAAALRSANSQTAVTQFKADAPCIAKERATMARQLQRRRTVRRQRTRNGGAFTMRSAAVRIVKTAQVTMRPTVRRIDLSGWGWA